MKASSTLFCIVALTLGGCGQSISLLSEEEVARYVPDTVRRIDRLQEIPEEVAGQGRNQGGARHYRER